MRKLPLPLCVICFIAFLMVGFACQKEARRDYPVKPVEFTKVKIMDEFWLPRMETNQRVTIPFAMQQNEETGRVDNFAIAGGLKDGEYKGERYNDTDVYKVMEGAAYTLATQPDLELEKYLDELIEVIAAAQEEDGYLFTPRTASPEKPVIGIGKEPWSNLAVSHELYNVGHMYEAAVAHYLATDKRNFLDIAIKNADLLIRTFGPDKLRAAPGHQEVEIGLVKLYRITGDEDYLNLAKYFLDQRGKDLKLKIYPEGHRFAIYNDPIQIQAHKPVLEQEEAVGHAVRAMYMYAGMADVAALTGSEEYIYAIDRLWENVVTKKMALTGGLGAHHDRERFGKNYELPNLTSYNETCAAIGSVMWNHRLFLLHKDAKFIDVLERTLYNAVIVGVSLEGDTFFYPNPLASDGKFRFNKGAACRQPWFGTACCPGNLVRFIPSVPGYIYAYTDDEIFINLFVASETIIDLHDQTIKVKQETRYPWEGKIRITISPTHEAEFTLYIRVPGWAQNHPVPGDLYRYMETTEEKPKLSVNAESVPMDLENGYARIYRAWKAGDVIEFDLPMPIRRVLSHPNVEENIRKLALERGPLVYCIEGTDHGGKALDLMLPGRPEFFVEYDPDLLKGLMVIKGKALQEGKEQALTAIPYYAWSHRGVGEMTVWINRTELNSVTGYSIPKLTLYPLN
ncbi:MAG: glycoside hydrolase family 127 protein [Candidatus Aminicenantes bacterium]|nr:glycoside hydrolase family 127 protein [Candidatus Aminicenantes bacterium]MDH5744189.1 glycoside hydrolase family 127 protein [Candidatus Aminicenantes bacterium]